MTLYLAFGKSELAVHWDYTKEQFLDNEFPIGVKDGLCSIDNHEGEQ
jgi:hypothetical protein